MAKTIVKQDFHAQVFFMTLCAVKARGIEEMVIKEYNANQKMKFNQKVNLTNALAGTMDVIGPLAHFFTTG